MVRCEEALGKGSEEVYEAEVTFPQTLVQSLRPDPVERQIMAPKCAQQPSYRGGGCALMNGGTPVNDARPQGRREKHLEWP